MRSDPIPTELLLEQHEGLPDDGWIDAVLSGLGDALTALADLSYVVHYWLGLEAGENPPPCSVSPTLEDVGRFLGLVKGAKAARDELTHVVMLAEENLVALEAERVRQAGDVA